MGFNVFDWDMFNWRVTNKYRMTCKHMLPSLKAGTPLYEIRALVNCYWLSCRRTDLFLVEANQGDINTRLSQSFSSSSFCYCTYKPPWSSTKAFPEAHVLYQNQSDTWQGGKGHNRNELILSSSVWLYHQFVFSHTMDYKMPVSQRFLGLRLE